MFGYFKGEEKPFQKVGAYHLEDIKKDVDEANEIAKFMNKDIQFTHIYLSKFDESSMFGGKSQVNDT